jgi:Ca-activated chloride channel family protein
MIDVTTPVRPIPGKEPSELRPSLPLLGVRARGRLDGLLFQLEVEQRYRNDGARPIEAVFTFPVPARAALLGFELELGERRLEAVAIARTQATKRYEDAIDAGDAAVLLEAAGNGLYTVSVGNLKAGESAVIRYRHAELLDAHRGLLRLQVPTVIAPRYGNPADAGLEGPAVPGTDLFVEYPFDIELLLAGIQDDVVLDSPTHSIRTHRGESGTVVRLARTARLDRDFVLEVPQAHVPKRALVARDGDEWVVLASVVRPGVPEADSRPLALTVVLDCSGSMAGESIDAARRAVGRVLESLDPRDRIGLLRFGSTHRWETDGLVPASRDQVARLRPIVQRIDADLGGTEMRRALQEAVRAPVPACAEARPVSADVLLITDGQVHELDRIAGRIAEAGRRLFVVAVGSAPNEALARRLSEVTGGACEFIASGELAEDAILRMFHRMRARPRTVSGVEWPGPAAWLLPPPKSVFPDQTVHLIAGLRAVTPAPVRITIGEAMERRDARSKVADGTEVRGIGTETVEIEMASESPPDAVLRTLLRVAAARRVAHLVACGAEAEATALAIRHQLATALTSFVVVAGRAAADKVKNLPATIPVPHAMPAGFMGVCEASVPLLRCDAPVQPPRELCDTTRFDRLMSRESTFAPVSGGARRRGSGPVSAAKLSSGQTPGGRRLGRSMAAALLAVIALHGKPMTSFEDLERSGLDPACVAALRALGAKHAAPAELVIAVFLEHLLATAEASADDRRAIEAWAAGPMSRIAAREWRGLRRDVRESFF